MMGKEIKGKEWKGSERKGAERRRREKEGKGMEGKGENERKGAGEVPKKRTRFTVPDKATNYPIPY